MALLSKKDQEAVTEFGEHLKALKGLGEAINESLAKVNGKRRVRVLSLDNVMSCLRAAVDGAEFSTANGGSVPNAYGYPADTTVCATAFVDGEVYWSIKTSPAHAASAGRAWTCLQPCTDYPLGDGKTKIAEWAKEANRLTRDQLAAVSFFSSMSFVVSVGKKAKEKQTA